MSVTGFPTGIKLGGSAPAGETSDGKIYIYNSSDSLVATITFSGDLTISSDVTFSDETTGFSITQNGVTLTIPQNLNLAKATAPATALTTITCSNTGTPDYDITDLTQTNPYGFVTADEGQTVLTVIKNLQTRLAELESKLQIMGLLA